MRLRPASRRRRAGVECTPVRHPSPNVVERQVTTAPHGHVLTNAAVWSPDSRRVVYDVRSDPAGAAFDGTRIESVDVYTGEVRTLYESRRGACCGVATYSPVEDKVVFILGPEGPTPDWSYAANRRRGVVVDEGRPGVAVGLDARDLVEPYTPGALRGGTHVHVFGGDGRWVSFTYQDHVLERFGSRQTPGPSGNDVDLRNVGVSVLGAGPVRVPRAHPRNHDGAAFSVLVTRTTADPAPGSDEVRRAFEDAWVGTRGYVRPDGSRQARALAFQGEVVTAAGEAISEVFVVDVPDDVAIPADDGPLQGTATRRPRPPRGTAQRRLTFTAGRKYPGIQGPRHWLRSSPDGSRIGFLMRDESGVVQLWTASPNGGPPAQVTRNPRDVASAFTWSPDGRAVAFVMDNGVWVTDVATGEGARVTARTSDEAAPRPEACVFSPDGWKIAYVRREPTEGVVVNQVVVAFLDGAPDPGAG